MISHKYQHELLDNNPFQILEKYSSQTRQQTNLWHHICHFFDELDSAGAALSKLHLLEDPTNFLYEQYWEQMYKRGEQSDH